MARAEVDDRTRPAQTAGASTPARRCLATGDTLPKSSLIRFVVAPGGAAVPDLAERLPGRGLWISARRDVIEAACRGNKFARAARRPVSVDPDLPAAIERQLLTRCMDAIRLARRAGDAVFGFDRVRTWLGRRPATEAAILLLGADSDADGANKLGGARDGPMRVMSCLTGAELGACFGKERVVFAAVAEGGIAARLAKDMARLADMRLRPGDFVPEKRADGPLTRKSN